MPKVNSRCHFAIDFHRCLRADFFSFVALTTITVSPNRRVIAVAERINDRPHVTIYDLQSLKRRKTLQSDLIKSNEIVSLLFSSDSKYLLTQGGGPDYSLVYWSWEKGKIMANIEVKPPTGPQANATVSQVSFNPQDNTQICTMGHGLFKMFRYAESALKPAQSLKQEHFNFTCHCWISEDRLLAGTDQGKLFVIQNGEILHEIKIDSRAEPRLVSMVSFLERFSSLCLSLSPLLDPSQVNILLMNV